MPCAFVALVTNDRQIAYAAVFFHTEQPERAAAYHYRPIMIREERPMTLMRAPFDSGGSTEPGRHDLPRTCGDDESTQAQAALRRMIDPQNR